jgi:hypothetical protein
MRVCLSPRFEAHSMIPRILHAMIAAAFLVPASVALAQAPAPAAPAPAAPAAPAMPSIPAHNCIAPDYPGKSANNDKIKAFNAAYTAYGDCIKNYVASVRTVRDAAMARGNEAVGEYNKFTDDIKTKMDADK